MVDFPAAHSMDTTWFAIDADGYVGIFDSGEGGALPDDLTAYHPESIQFSSELLELLAADNGRLIDRNAVDIDFILKNASLQILKLEIQKSEKLGKKYKYLFSSLRRSFLITTSQLTAEILHKHVSGCIDLFDRNDLKVIYIDACDLNWLKDAISSGLVIAGSSEIYLGRNLNLLGWHNYECDASFSDVYVRERLPVKSIHFQDLPDIIIKNMQITELPNLRFIESEIIQPIKHVYCRTWKGESSWQGTDGEWHEGLPDYSIPYSERFPDRK